MWMYDVVVRPCRSSAFIVPDSQGGASFTSKPGSGGERHESSRIVLLTCNLRGPAKWRVKVTYGQTE